MYHVMQPYMESRWIHYSTFSHNMKQFVLFVNHYVEHTIVCTSSEHAYSFVTFVTMDTYQVNTGTFFFGAYIIHCIPIPEFSPIDMLIYSKSCKSLTLITQVYRLHTCVITFSLSLAWRSTVDPLRSNFRCMYKEELNTLRMIIQ